MLDINSSALLDLLRNERAAGNAQLTEHLKEIAEECKESGKSALEVIENFGGGPVGLETLAASIGEDAGTIEDVYEPYLLQIGFLNRTPRGRMVTSPCYKHFGIDEPGQTEEKK